MAWQLKGDKHLTFKKKLLEVGNWELKDNGNLIWNETSKKIRKLARVVVSELKGFGPR